MFEPRPFGLELTCMARLGVLDRDVCVRVRRGDQLPGVAWRCENSGDGAPRAVAVGPASG